MDIRCPGVGVAMAIALAPVGVVPLGVNPPGDRGENGKY